MNKVRRKKQTQTESRDDVKESCPQCASTDFSINDSSPNQRYCNNGHVWLPQTKDQIMLNDLRHKFGLVKNIVGHVDVMIKKIDEEKLYDNPDKLKEVHTAIRSALGQLR